MTITARVQNGRLVLDEPTTLPEGQLVELVIVKSPTERTEPVEANPAPPSPSKATRPLGMLRGTFSVPPDFNAPLPADIQSFFEGEHG